MHSYIHSGCHECICDHLITHFDTLGVGWVEDVTPKPNRHQKDEGPPRSSTAPGALMLGPLTLPHNVPFVHCRTEGKEGNVSSVT